MSASSLTDDEAEYIYEKLFVCQNRIYNIFMGLDLKIYIFKIMSPDAFIEEMKTQLFDGNNGDHSLLSEVTSLNERDIHRKTFISMLNERQKNVKFFLGLLNKGQNIKSYTFDAKTLEHIITLKKE